MIEKNDITTFSSFSFFNKHYLRQQSNSLILKLASVNNSCLINCRSINCRSSIGEDAVSNLCFYSIKFLLHTSAYKFCNLLLLFLLYMPSLVQVAMETTSYFPHNSTGLVEPRLLHAATVAVNHDYLSSRARLPCSWKFLYHGVHGKSLPIPLPFGTSGFIPKNRSDKPITITSFIAENNFSKVLCWEINFFST